MLGVNAGTVTSSIKKGHYREEKERRRIEGKKRNIEQTKKIVAEKRGKDKGSNDEVLMAGVKLLQEQNAIAMSRKRKVSDDQIVEMNIRHYVYNPQKSRIEFDESSGKRPADLPQIIKVNKREDS